MSVAGLGRKGGVQKFGLARGIFEQHIALNESRLKALETREGS